MSDLPGLQRRRGERSFAEWDEFVSPELVKQSEEAIHDLINRLIALGTNPTQEDVQSEVDTCVRRFNDLDAMDENSWIMTIEREDIIDVVGELIELCGFEDSEDWLGERDW